MNTVGRIAGPLSAILVAVALGAVANMSAAANSVPMTIFKGAWESAAAYSPGEVVTYNGASYICLVKNKDVLPSMGTKDWSTLATGGISVLDAKGVTIGRYVTGTVFLTIKGQNVFVDLDFNNPLSTTGWGVQNVSVLTFYHIASDCSDARLLNYYYFGARPLFVVPSSTASETLFYPASAPTLQSVTASETFTSGQDPNMPGTCTSGLTGTLLVEEEASMDVTTLGFVPPFHLQ